jgi:hypothetical protein
MRRIQFDENINAVHLVDACRKEGLVEPLRFPKKRTGEGWKDPDVLAKLLPTGNLFLTLDARMTTDHSSHIPASHGGILVIAQDDDELGQMTSHKAQKILAGFKSVFPGWNEVPWNNSVVDLTPASVSVRHVEGGRLTVDCFADRRSDGWDMIVRDALRKNARMAVIEPSVEP